MQSTKLTKENKAHRKAQAEAREAMKPRQSKDFVANPLPNRKTRRQQAMKKNRATWKEANQQWQTLNKQTFLNPNKGRHATKKERAIARRERAEANVEADTNA